MDFIFKSAEWALIGRWTFTRINTVRCLKGHKFQGHDLRSMTFKSVKNLPMVYIIQSQNIMTFIYLARLSFSVNVELMLIEGYAHHPCIMQLVLEGHRLSK